MAKLEKEELGLEIDELAHLATHGHNSSIHGHTGYARPSNGPGDALVSMSFPTALMLESRTLAIALAFKRADAAEKPSRLGNANARKSQTFNPGDLAMLWRQRLRQGRGGWTGPLRVLLQEGSTVWLATGATLVRAQTNQVRPCAERATGEGSIRRSQPCWRPRYTPEGRATRVDALWTHGTPRLTLFTLDKSVQSNKAS